MLSAERRLAIDADQRSRVVARPSFDSCRKCSFRPLDAVRRQASLFLRQIKWGQDFGS
jgi:hypothetical protein